MKPLLEIEGLSKHFDGVRALDGFSCVVEERELLGLIGPNGAGKTTLFNVISGFLAPEAGSVRLRGRELVGLPSHRITRRGVARTFQQLRLIRRLTVRENVLLCFPNQPGERLGPLFFLPPAVRRRELEIVREADRLLTEVGLEDKAEDLAEALSYGQQKLLSIACCLASGAELLLLDEPVAGVNPEMIERILEMIRELPRTGKTVVLIEHNIDAVMETCHRVIFMDLGRMVSEGKPSEVRADPHVIEAYLG